MGDNLNCDQDIEDQPADSGKEKPSDEVMLAAGNPDPARTSRGIKIFGREKNAPVQIPERIVDRRSLKV